MKQIEKLFTSIIISFCCLFLLVSCSDTHEEKGYVIEKNHKEPYDTVMVSMIYTGKTLIPVTHIIHHSETWSLDLQDEVEGEYKNYKVYLKNSEIWEQIQIGDYFIWNEETCFDCEPTTRERQ